MAEKNRTHSFVVRIWQEHADRSETIWRGRVEHVTSGEFAFFRHLEQLLAFIRDRSGALSLFDHSEGQSARKTKGARIRRVFRRGGSS